MIRILVLRDRSFAGLVSAMMVESDGKPVAKVRGGGRATFEIPRGDHMMTVRRNLLRSRPVEIAADGGDNHASTAGVGAMGSRCTHGSARRASNIGVFDGVGRFFVAIHGSRGLRGRYKRVRCPDGRGQ